MGWGNQDRGDPPSDIFERLLTDSRTFVTLAVVSIGAWLLSGIYFIQEGEIGIVRRFGKEVRQTTPGLNYRLPWPVERLNVVNVAAIRRAEIGFRSRMRSGEEIRRAISESLMLTGDENIVDAQMIVQYKVREPSKFLFRLRNPEDTLHAAAEVALRSVVGKTTIDDALTVGRAQVQVDILQFLQKLMDVYQSGIQITEIKLQVVDPPEQVKDAFHEVVRAREDRERLINQARGYREDLIPRARGEGQKVMREAEAYKAERILRAQGNVARFLALYEEYQKAKQVTRDRLYLETMERVLPNASKFVVDQNVNTSVVPLMPTSSFAFGDSAGGVKSPASSDQSSGVQAVSPSQYVGRR